MLPKCPFRLGTLPPVRSLELILTDEGPGSKSPLFCLIGYASFVQHVCSAQVYILCPIPATARGVFEQSNQFIEANLSFCLFHHQTHNKVQEKPRDGSGVVIH